MKVIAADFDGCLCENMWPEIGRPNSLVISALIRERQNGVKLILWTCREGDLLNDALAWCKEYGLEFDAVNDNLPENIEQYGNNCRKVWADEYWDDKSVIVHAGERPSVLSALDDGCYSLHRWKTVELRIARLSMRERLKRRWNKWRCE